MIFLPIIVAALAVDQPLPQSAPTQAAPAVAQSEDGFKVGVDTLATVIAKLGNPNSTNAASDGTVVISYMTVNTRIKGASFIPIVGLFAGGATGKSRGKSFTFGADGLLKAYSSNNFQTDCKVFAGCR